MNDTSGQKQYNLSSDLDAMCVAQAYTTDSKLYCCIDPSALFLLHEYCFKAMFVLYSSLFFVYIHIIKQVL